MNRQNKANKAQSSRAAPAIRRSSSVASAALLCVLVTGTAQAGPTTDCTCRAKDVVAKEGETVCLDTPNGGKLALCQKVLNNTSWKFLPGSCSHWVTKATHGGIELEFEPVANDGGPFHSPLDASPAAAGSSARAREIVERL